MATLPYLSSPGNIPKALSAIKAAATPPKVSQDFVKTKLGITGSSGDQMCSFLKRLGFSEADGTPTEIYKSYRGDEGKFSLARAIKQTYKPLYERNEYLHECNENQLRDIIAQETGYASDARPLALTLSTIKHLFAHADFGDDQKNFAIHANFRPASNFEEISETRTSSKDKIPNDEVKLNLGYTINLNLPETTDIEVFNAIFKSIRMHLIRQNND